MVRRLPALLVLFLLFVGCRTANVLTTPPELRSIPRSQSAALTVAIERIQAESMDPVDIVALLQADQAAWDRLDEYYSSFEEGE